MARKRNKHRYITLISLLVVVSFTNFSVSASYPALGNASYTGNNLQPQHRIFGINEKIMLESAVLDQLKGTPEILFPKEDLTSNLFSKLKSAKTVDVGFGSAQPLKFIGEFDDPRIEGIFIIPCCVEKTPYYVQILYYENGDMKSAAYSEKEFIGYCEELVKSGKLTAEEAGRLREMLSTYSLDKDRGGRFIAAIDESVQAVAVFLEKIGAQNTSMEFRKKVNERKVILTKQPVPAAGTIVVSEAKNEKIRAVSILRSVLIDKGVKHQRFEQAFEKFWELWKRDQADEFNLDKVEPELKPVIWNMEKGPENASNEGYVDHKGNKAMIMFSEKAYERTISVEGVDISNCQETIDDIKKIFREVALHDIRKHNEAIEKLKISGGEKAAKKLSEDTTDIPGMNPDKIMIERFRDLADSLLPTDIIDKNGTIRINENFVRLLTKLKRYLKSPRGDIYAYPVNDSSEVIGELYSSIIYSLAIHTIRGHFPINDWGFSVFNTDEYLAQGERGNKYLYTNLLGMMYYWVWIVEAHRWPRQRAEFLIEEYPALFQKLKPEEREMLPRHLLALCVFQEDGKEPLFPQAFHETGSTIEDVKRFLQENPDSVSNEGRIGADQNKNVKGIPKFLTLSIFQLLSAEGEVMSEREIAAALGGVDISSVSRSLDILTELDIVTSLGTEQKSYEAVVMPFKRELQVAKVLATSDFSNKTDLKQIKGEVYKIIEPVWADAFLDAAVYGSLAQEIKIKRQKIILAIETDWIPREQKALIQALIQEITKLGGSIEVVRESADELGNKVRYMVEKKGVPAKNIIVLASRNTIEGKDFAGIRAEDDTDTDKAFLIGVDSKDLTADSYVRLLEILTMAVHMACGRGIIFDHPSIKVIKKNSRTFIFIPRAEPLDYEHSREIYDAQMKPIAKAA